MSDATDVEAAIRQLLALLGQRPTSPRQTFGELARDWFRRVAKRRVCPANEDLDIRRMKSLWELREGELTKAAIEDLVGDVLKPNGTLGPTSVNNMLSTGKLIVRDAQGNGLWHGLNPFDFVRRVRVPKRVYLTLTLEEVKRVLRFLRLDRRRLSKTILMVGMRPGEAYALQKLDVDLKRRMMKVCRSHGRNQTKTGKEREFPIPDGLLADLRAAMRDSPSQLVFPRPDGTRQRKDTKLSRVLRTALGKAGIVTGYRYTCRRKGCRLVETRPRKKKGEDCPRCGFRFWVSAIPKQLRFYDLRHSASTLHHEAKCDPLVVKELLGHALDITEGTYTHLNHEYRRTELNRLRLV